MKTTAVAPFILLVLAVSALASDYEVTIDGQTYLFSEGVKQEIILKNGQRISVSVKGVRIKKFRKHGISFDYPSEMKFEEESIEDVTQITLDSTDSTLFLIQVHPATDTPAEVHRHLAAKLRNELASVGARFPAKSTAPCKRAIGGVERQGMALLFAFGDLEYRTEIYTMRKSKKTVAIVLQYAEEDKRKAAARIDVVTKSFK